MRATQALLFGAFLERWVVTLVTTVVRRSVALNRPGLGVGGSEERGAITSHRVVRTVMGCPSNWHPTDREGERIMTMRLRIWIALLPVVALLAALALIPASAGASPFGFPPGIYTTTITDADYPPGFPEEGKAPGTWTSEFTADGRVIVTHEAFAGVLVEGRYVSNPARLVVTDESGPFACFNLNPGWATAVYGWSFDGNQLTLTAVRDACFARAIVFTAHPLQLQP